MSSWRNNARVDTNVVVVGETHQGALPHHLAVASDDLPYIGPWNQNERSLCLCGLSGPYKKSYRRLFEVDPKTTAGSINL